IAPNVVRAAVIRDPEASAGIGQFAIIQAAATAVGVEVTAVNGRDAWSIERAVTAFSGRPNGGLIVTASAVSATQRDLIITLSTRQQLPTVYWQRFFATGGGLISYGPDLLDMYRRAAGYIDQIAGTVEVDPEQSSAQSFALRANGNIYRSSLCHADGEAR